MQQDFLYKLVQLELCIYKVQYVHSVIIQATSLQNPMQLASRNYCTGLHPRDPVNQSQNASNGSIHVLAEKIVTHILAEKIVSSNILFHLFTTCDAIII